MRSEAGAFSDLPEYPEGWREEKLEDVIAINPELLGSGTPETFQFRYIDIGSVDRGVIDWSSVTTQVFSTAPSRARRVVRPDDVLLSTVRPALQAHAFADWEEYDGYVCSTGFAVLRSGDSLVPRYLYHLVFSDVVANQLHRLETGSNYPAVGESDVRLVRIPVPLQWEQRRIAAILDTVDEAIRQTEKLIAKLKQIKAGLLHDLLTRGLDEEGRLRDSVAHPEQFKETELGRLPAAWEILQVGEIFDMQLGKMLSKAAKTGRSPFPYLANRNVQWDRVDLSNLPTMDFSDEERAKYSLREGDLLVCEGGEIGRTAIWRGEMANCFYQKAIHRLRPKDGRVLPRYMLRYMHKAVHESYFTKLTSQTSIAHLTQEKLELLPVPLPPLDEQRAIVEVFETHDTRIRAEETYRDKLAKLKKGLMQDLLTGRVRVTDVALDGVAV